MKPLRIVFFGTPAFAVPSLEAAHAAGHQIVSVVTQPDRPRGRGHKVTPSPIKSVAGRLGLPVIQPLRLNDEAFIQHLKDTGAELGVVAAYGRILPTAVLQAPRLGMINVHASLLPRWRGAAPVHRAILAGDLTTGVTIMKVVKELDAGPMLAKSGTSILETETSEDLERRLAVLGAEALVPVIAALASGPVPAVEQDPALVTYASRLERAESRVDWHQPALVVHNRIRGLQPWPLAAVRLHGKRILLRRSEPLSNEAHGAAPGAVIRIDPDAIVIATAAGAIRLLTLQLEGRPAVSAAAFLNGHRVQPGDRFEDISSAAP